MIDEKNILRIDLHLIYQSVKRQAQYAIQTLFVKDPTFHPDQFAISENEYEQLHEFAMSAAANIANDTHRVKYLSQTGIDGLTYYQDYENPTEAASYSEGDPEVTGDETITNPDGVTVLTKDISGQQFTDGEKLVRENQDTVRFVIYDDFDTARTTPITKTHERFTYVQQFIFDAMVNHILMKWWFLKGLNQLAETAAMNYSKSVGSVRMNITSSHNSQKVRLPQKPFYGF